MGFQVGQLVVCVDGSTPLRGYGYGDEALPRAGIVYTIRGFSPSDGGVWLCEIVNQERLYKSGSDVSLVELSFRHSRFRPLDESRLTVFRQMLVTPPSKELVDEDLDARIADCERAVREALGF